MPSNVHGRERMNKWFQPADGIAREVVTADIQRYLGRDALVRPGTHDGMEGYWITAYRNLTTEMVQDLKADSLRWRAEQQSHTTRGGSPHVRDTKGARRPDKAAAPAYLDSQTHQSRQYYGPSVTPAPPVESHYGAPASAHSSRDPYGQAPVREAGYPQGHPGYQATGYPQSSGAAYANVPAGYQQDSFQSPHSAYSNMHAATPGAYSSASNYSASTQATNYSAASGYPTAQQGSYVTSTTPQSYDAANQPRTMSGYEGYAPPGSRTTADAYGGRYQTGQPQAQSGYAYTTGGGTPSGRETAYQTQPVGSSTAAATQAYYEQYARAQEETTTSSSSSSGKRSRAHESSSHRRR